jgi:hypothetical protein
VPCPSWNPNACNMKMGRVGEVGQQGKENNDVYCGFGGEDTGSSKKKKIDPDRIHLHNNNSSQPTPTPTLTTTRLEPPHSLLVSFVSSRPHSTPPQNEPIGGLPNRLSDLLLAPSLTTSQLSSLPLTSDVVELETDILAPPPTSLPLFPCASRSCSEDWIRASGRLLLPAPLDLRLERTLFRLGMISVCESGARRDETLSRGCRSLSFS